MQRIKKGDTIEVIAGKDLGERGEVLVVLPKEDRVVVQGVNTLKRHRKVGQVVVTSQKDADARHPDSVADGGNG